MLSNRELIFLHNFLYSLNKSIYLKYLNYSVTLSEKKTNILLRNQIGDT